MGNLDPLLAGIKRVSQDGIILPVASPPSIVLNAVSPTKITPNSTTGNYDIQLLAGGANGGGWINSTLGVGGTFDWTAQPTQSFAADTTVVVGGITWTTVNTANSSPQVNVLNGTGLVFTPTSNSGSGPGDTQYQPGTKRTAPMMMVNLTQIIPGYRLSTAVEISAYWTTGSPVANFDVVFSGIDDGGAQQLGYRYGRAFDSSQAHQQLQSSVNGGYITRDVLLGNLANVNTLTFPDGIAINNVLATISTGVPVPSSGTWPSDDQMMTNLVGAQYVANSSWQNTIANYYACFGAQRQGSSTNLIATLAAVRIRYR